MSFVQWNTSAALNRPRRRPEPLQMDSPEAMAQRLTDLEIKASFSEDLLDKLDQVIVRQQQQIDLLLREVADLKHQAPPASGTGAARNLRDDLPPHF